MSTELGKIAAKARTDGKLRFTSLTHLLGPEFLKETWKQMNRYGASGVDGETIRDFEKDLDGRINDLHGRLKAGRYKAPPVRSVDIPKGNGKTRPLGIPTVEDRLVQRAVARILEAIFEADFLDVSHGFRPGRNPHQALSALRKCIMTGKVRYVFEADIRGYFNHIDHGWLMRMLRTRVADPKILRLIEKWLRARAIENGVVTIADEGTPQGGPISPLPANVYLHCVLDTWFERVGKKWFRGEAHLIRCADDFVVCFEYKRDAELFHRSLVEGTGKFGLELAGEKTRLLPFGRSAREDIAKVGEKLETFDFLGFTHVCGKDRKGRFAVIRVPSKKSIRKFLDRIKQWLKAHMHWERRNQQRHLSSMLRGRYQYFGLYHCTAKLADARVAVQRQWAWAIWSC
ncbi:MAG: group II intron reverse transcriptase/maturase [Firmicutes bacterium]|jgi:RNA-directed DNA polymerase|nr:group II intron reverse transcriptase/maturase [Bacillota bacterium]MDD4791619.1 group II intron reverse transcriptase/maturase [Bacillota bacterium]